MTSQDQTSGAIAAPATNPADDDKWHLAISPYLWFAGVHGTIGARDRSASFHASVGDVLSKLNIGLMGAVEARKRRFVVPIDFMWIKLSDDTAIPEEAYPGVSTIKAKMTETIFTPKVGYRVVDSPKLQTDVLVGLRYWHLGENLSFQPSGILADDSQAANFVDVVAGAKISMALSPKASVTILGDAGGGQANVDYQVAAYLGYRIKPTVMLGVGWRYLDINYRPSSTFVYDAAQQGVLIGATFNLK
ncbi:hypothetical protein [Tunturiibacter gelidoferens]|uniref:Uncharacterized protein n=1 Tax=Tunturiibacter gelidiferens TaxID=3069689 RepID=A0A9X0QA72_9BACT|nr:hypothetical protein [Edaphobacter lichenicola]MBB5326518.1 hypothetical protein [Edaphobacter lichenicola]